MGEGQAQAQAPALHRTEQRLSPWGLDGDDGDEQHYQRKRVAASSSFFRSPRGLSLFTRSWLPLDAPPKALIFMLHGYTADISWTLQNTAISFTAMGYGAFAMDIEGHGQSEGLKAFVPNLDLVAQDCLAFFNSKKQEEQYRDLPCFLFGESLGGGICLLIHHMDPDGWNGAVLVAPMCKISDSIKPPWPLPQMLTFFSRIAPTWAVVPTKDLRPLSFKDPAKLELCLRNPLRYTGKPRLGTAREMVRVTSYLSERLQDVSLPFIVLHGGGDVVVDPAVSKALFENAKSCDKTLKLYENMWHAILAGESDDDVQVVMSDIKVWLHERVTRNKSFRGDEIAAA